MLLACFHCRLTLSLPQDLPSFPLCRFCLDSLSPCGDLCSRCGEPTPCDTARCHTTPPSPIQSYRANYLLSGNCYSLLKTWKKRRGPLLNRQLFSHSPLYQDSLELLKVDAVVPIPQALKRSWKLRGSPAELLANHYATLLKTKTLPNLMTTWEEANRSPQATRSKRERNLDANHFAIHPNFADNPERIPTKILLVDDFMTTGSTLRAAAAVLQRAGAQEIHSICLGKKTLSAVRPASPKQSSHTHPSETQSPPRPQSARDDPDFGGL